jgi:signal peptidase I
MPRILRVVSGVLQAVVVATALAVAGYLIVPSLIGWQMVTVLSGSMAPAYPTDSVLAVEPVPAADVRAGDVIAYRVDPDTPLVTHRVIEVRTGPVFVTKGDANEDPDAKPVAAADLRGRVVLGVPALGGFIRAVHRPAGFVLLLVVPALLVVGQQFLAHRRRPAPR